MGDVGCAGDIGESIAVFIVVVAVIVFLIFIGVPFLIALGELLLILLLAVAGVVGRVFFRRPWTVDAVGPDREHTTWSVVGWRASGAARDFVAEQIRLGGSVPTVAEVEAAVLGR